METKAVLEKLLSEKKKTEIEKRYGKLFYEYNRYFLKESRRGSFEKFIHFLVQIQKRLRNKKGTLLDLGSGFGLHSLILTVLGYEVFSLEISSEKLQIQNSLLSDYDKRAACHPMESDALHLPFRDASLDVVFANEFISHVPNLSKSIDEIYRVLKAGGELVISDTDRFSLFSILLALTRKDTDKKYKEIRKNIIKQHIQEHNHALTEDVIQNLASITNGLVTSEIKATIDAFVKKGDFLAIIKKCQRREPLGRVFRHRSPHGQYSDRFFTPTEIAKLFDKDFANQGFFYPLVSSPLSHLISYGLISTLEGVFPKLLPNFLAQEIVGKYVVYGMKK